MATKKETTGKATRFSKKALLMSAIFANRKDVLGVVVNDGEEITVDEAQARIEKFMKGRVR